MAPHNGGGAAISVVQHHLRAERRENEAKKDGQATDEVAVR